MTDDQVSLQRSFVARYGEYKYNIPVTSPVLQHMADRGSCRDFTNKPVDADIIETLSAVALSSPTKSDLQQRDIIIVTDDKLRGKISQLLGNEDWTANAPVLLIFCGNHRRQQQLSEWRNKPFPNQHLDAFFNASVDAGIALSAFVLAAESIGLGCCPISQIRNHCEAISDMLQLPQYVFPIAGLAVGWPAHAPTVSMRLPLSTTVHHNQFNESEVKSEIDSYDQRRASQQPYSTQRDPGQFGITEPYGWSEDKARQYAEPQRTDFGAFIKAKGFILD